MESEIRLFCLHFHYFFMLIF